MGSMRRAIAREVLKFNGKSEKNCNEEIFIKVRKKMEFKGWPDVSKRTANRPKAQL
jgi:hypothetical protein